MMLEERPLINVTCCCVWRIGGWYETREHGVELDETYFDDCRVGCSLQALPPSNAVRDRACVRNL